MRHAREHARGGVVGSNQRQVQHVVQRQPVVRLEIGRRGGVDIAALDGDFLVRSGLSSRNTTAVITLVMLAMERLSCAFSCQSTSPFAGLKMIAAAARISGTRSPFASVLYRGVIASCSDARRIRWSFAGAGGGTGAGEPGFAGLRGGRRNRRASRNAGRRRRAPAVRLWRRFLVRDALLSGFCRQRQAHTQSQQQGADTEKPQGLIRRTNPPYDQRRHGWLGSNRCNEDGTKKCNSKTPSRQQFI